MPRIWKFGRDVDTDQIVPGRYAPYMLKSGQDVRDYAFIEARPEFTREAKPGDILVAGRNFGCGSSREHAPIALSHSGIKAVLALSFARIFYRNSVDGAFLLPIEINEDAYQGISDGDEVEIDISTNEIKNISKNQIYKMKPFSEIIGKIIDAGGLFKYQPD